MNQLASTIAWSLGVAIPVVALGLLVRNQPGSVMNLRRAHLIAGAVTLLAFVFTGLYMRYTYAHVGPMERATRLMFRSAHIYVLYSALLNLVLGSYLKPLNALRPRRLQIIGSIGVLAIPALLVASFLAESQNLTFHRPIAVAAIYLSLAGAALHFSASLAGGENGDAA